jgi:hypothetical protein
MGQAAEAEQLLEPLEGKLDLPADAVKLQHPCGVEHLCREGGEGEDEWRGLKRARIRLSPFATGCPANASQGPGSQRRRKPDRHDTTGDRGRAGLGE